MDSIKKIVKRDGRMVDFDVNKIAQAIFKAAQVLGGKDRRNGHVPGKTNGIISAGGVPQHRSLP